MEIFGKRVCIECGTGIEKNAVKKLDKLFCSQEHASEYAKRSEEGHHCCC